MARAGVGVFEVISGLPCAPWPRSPHIPRPYRGWRLVSLDGSQTSARNTPQQLRHLSKETTSRRFQAAFAKVALCWLVELGTHAPLAIVGGWAQESEWVLAPRLLSQKPAGCLHLADRLYGVAAFVNELLVVGHSMGS